MLKVKIVNKSNSTTNTLTDELIKELKVTTLSQYANKYLITIIKNQPELIYKVLLGNRDNKQNNVKRQAREQFIIHFMFKNTNERVDKRTRKKIIHLSQAIC